MHTYARADFFCAISENLSKKFLFFVTSRAPAISPKSANGWGAWKYSCRLRLTPRGYEIVPRGGTGFGVFVVVGPLHFLERGGASRVVEYLGRVGRAFSAGSYLLTSTKRPKRQVTKIAGVCHHLPIRVYTFAPEIALEVAPVADSLGTVLRCKLSELAWCAQCRPDLISRSPP